MAAMEEQEAILDRKIKTCTTVKFYNLESSITKQIIVYYLMKQELANSMKSLTQNRVKNTASVTFASHQVVKDLYEQKNFSDPILKRVLNISFSLNLEEHEVQLFELHGLTEENQKIVFHIARKYGICRLKSSYVSRSYSNLRPNGLLSFARVRPFSEDETKRLTKELAEHMITVSEYTGNKMSIELFDFMSVTNAGEADSIMDDGLKRFLTGAPSVPISKTFSIRTKADGSSSQARCLLQYSNSAETISNFEFIRKKLINEPEGKVLFRNIQKDANSFSRLFARGLINPNKFGLKVYEDNFLEALRLISPGVVQVSVYEIREIAPYFATIIFTDEDSGKQFLIKYLQETKHIWPFFGQNVQPSFNINLDKKTLARLGQAKTRATDVANKLKITEPPNNTRNPYNDRINPSNVGMNFGFVNPMQAAPGGQGMPILFGAPFIQGGMPMPPGMHPMSAMHPMPPNPNNFLADMKRMKEEPDIEKTRREIFNKLFVIFKNLNKTDSTASALAETLTKEKELSELFKLIENPASLKGY